MFSSVRQAIAWFIDGLVEAVAAIGDRSRRRTPLRVVAADGGYAIAQPDGSGQPTQLTLETAGGTARFAPAEAAAMLKDQEVDLVLPAGELLVRALDPLPADSRSYLDGIVRHQLERLVPWRSDDVIYSYQVAPAGPRDDRLVVTISATARSLHAGLIGALSALAPRKLQLLYTDVPQIGGDVAIRIDDNSAETARLGRLRVGAVAMLAALLIVSAAGFGYLAYTWQQATAAIASADDAIVDLRKKLAARGSQEPAAERDHAAILARKLQTPVAVTAVDALATVLPDDTWLTELRVADGHVRVTGVSRNVAGLVPLIEANPAFAEATFFAPTTRLPDNQGDRFYLDARLVPGGRR